MHTYVSIEDHIATYKVCIVIFLILKIHTDIQCNNLSIPTNGNASCSSGTVGVGYEGDTCSFTCNTGYELSNSNTIARTCQSDGSWNGTDNDCRRGEI